MTYLAIFTLFISLVIFCYFFRNKNGLPTNWPLVGMFPALLKNFHRVNDFFIEFVEKSSQLTFQFKASWFSNMNLIITVDPFNIHHVFSKSFGNYIKGPKFNEKFDIVGDGIFNADSSLWQYHRRLAHSFFGHPKFSLIFTAKVWEEVRSRLIPLLDNVSKHGVEIDLQDMFKRFSYDNVCNILMDYDPKFLSLDLPPIPLSQAVVDIEDVVFRRHVMPTSLWKFLRWLGVGEEKYQKDCQIVRDFINKIIDMKREERKLFGIPKEESEVIFDNLLTIYMNDVENPTTPINSNNGDRFLRDSFLNFFIAGGDTTSVAFSWLFYLLTENPLVANKIREELNNIMGEKDNDNNNNKNDDDFLRKFTKHKNELVYLHGAICETIRLYPPVPFNHKNSVASDILPSGHQVKPDMQVVFDVYAQGRTKSIWGDDCNEFKPERWITERGTIKIEPSNKFLAFGAGPRICQGKDMALTQIKIVVAAIIRRYDIVAVQGHQVVPDISINLQMKHGFKVQVRDC